MEEERVEEAEGGSGEGKAEKKILYVYGTQPPLAYYLLRFLLLFLSVP